MKKGTQNKITEYRKYKNKAVKKSKYWVAIILTFVMMLMLIITFRVFMETFIQYVFSDRLEEEIKEAESMGTEYETLGKDGLAVYDNDYFILDSEGTIIASRGKNTCNMKKKGKWMNMVSEKEFHIIYADFTNKNVVPKGDSLEVGFWEIFDSSMKLNVSDWNTEQHFDSPLWIQIPVKNGAEKLVVKAPVRIYLSSLVMMVSVILTTGAMFFVIFVIMIVFCINNILSYRRLSDLFFTNVVTGGKNHNWFIVNGSRIIKKCSSDKRNFAYLSIDVVKYSSFCLCHSVAEGEEMLRSVFMELLKKKNRGELCVLNNSSDFAMMLRYNSEEEIRERIEKILNAASAATGHYKIVFHIGVYLDAAKKNEKGKYRRRKDDDFEALFNNAAMSCHTIADKPVSAIAYYDDDLAEEHRWENLVFEAQQEALDKEEFLVYYQPKYDPNTNKLRGAEALIRWQSPKYGFLSPGKFIPIFEKNGFITKIDRYMLEHVAKDQKRWLDEGRECVPVSVNVSRVHFAEKDLADQIRDIVESAGTPRELIEIELTESAFFDDKRELLSIIKQLKDYGFMISMDDFGSGYSSLNSLKDMPLDVLKLDAEFFRGENEGDRGRIIVAETIRMARSLHMLTVAEGVEEKNQVDFLAEQHCDMIQGFYYARPMPSYDYETRMGVAPEGEKDSVEESLAEGSL